MLYDFCRCNGASTRTVRATPAFTLEQFRELVMRCCAGTSEIVVLNYSRKALGQTGDGHFSPIGGYNATEDMVLLLDVARFKYPPHWIKLELAFASMQLQDASLGVPRGLVVLTDNKQLNGPQPVDLDRWAYTCCNLDKSAPETTTAT
jgi:glutathione gamma-glutamylcysteinyltransferase